jgi:membrane protease YdiL (CAAX protease family)
LEADVKGVQGVSLVVVIYGLAATSLTTGICEEIVWRGYLQTRFGRLLRGRIWMATSLQALLFGFWHSISVHTLFTAAFGLVYGYVYARQRGFYPSW